MLPGSRTWSSIAEARARVDSGAGRRAGGVGCCSHYHDTCGGLRIGDQCQMPLGYFEYRYADTAHRASQIATAIGGVEQVRRDKNGIRPEASAKSILHQPDTLDQELTQAAPALGCPEHRALRIAASVTASGRRPRPPCGGRVARLAPTPGPGHSGLGKFRQSVNAPGSFTASSARIFRSIGTCALISPEMKRL